MSDYMKEAERLLEQYDNACLSIIDMSKEQARAALLAHIQRGAVPEGYDIAPAFRGYAKLGIGQYVVYNCPRTDEDHPWLVIAIATEEEKAGLQVGELRQSQPWLMIQPERIAVRIDFTCAAALDALEQQLRFLREDSFPESLTAPAPDQLDDTDVADMAQAADATRETSPAPAEVPMPKPVAYGFGNTAITGHTNRLMMVRIDIPGGDQYAGAFWLPLVLADEALTYGADCRADGEAAGYTRGVADERERCASVAWAHYMDTCRRKGIGPDVLPDWCCAAALRGEVKP